MKSILTIFILISFISSVYAKRSRATFLGAFHDAKNEKIVFSIHYLRGKTGGEHISGGAYIKINGKKYPINSSGTMICGSHTAGKNCIAEYIIRGYKVVGDDKEIPSLRSLRNVVFGYDFIVNGEQIHFEKDVKFTKYEQQAEQVVAPDA